MPALRVLAATITLVVVRGSPSRAQAVERTTYVSFGAGFAAEPSVFSVRSGVGLSLAASSGRDLSAHAALEARLGGELFGAPTQFISPGGCLGQEPCLLPQPSTVHVLTLATNLVLSTGVHSTGPLLILGAGLRHVTETPGFPTETRPFGEIGGGIARSFGASTIGLEARYQLAGSAASLPRWTMPVGLNVRFF